MQFKSLQDLINKHYKTVTERVVFPWEAENLSRKGFCLLDCLPDIAEKGRVSAIAARPGMGKSTFSLQLALNLALAGTPVSIVSSETDEEEFLLRLLWVSGAAEEPEKLARLPITFTAIQEPSLPEGIGAVLPTDPQDILLLDCAGSVADSEVSAFLKQIKALAQKNNLPILLTANIPYIMEDRVDKRPLLSDAPFLSGLDHVFFLYRRAYYETDLESVQDEDDYGDNQLLIAKGLYKNIAVPLAFTGGCFRYAEEYCLPRVELSAHSVHDETDSILKGKELVDFAKEHNMPAVALTDTNTVAGFPEFERECRKARIKPIYGAKIIHGSFKGRYPCVSTVLVKNQTGLENLYKIISALEDDGVCVNVPISVLEQYREGLLYGSAGHEGPLFSDYLSERFDEYEDFLRFYDYFEIESFYGTAREQAINKRIVERAEELGKPVAAVSDARTLRAYDSVCLDILDGRTKRWFTKTENLHLRTCDEMLRAFSYLGNDTKKVVLYDPKKIAGQIESVSVIPYGWNPAIIPHAYDEVENIALAFLQEKYGEEVPFAIRERLRTELETVDRAGFADHYLLAAKLTGAAKAAGGLWNTRGAAASSFLTYCLGISEINPLKPHYRCPDCKRIEWVEDAASGYDLPEKKCDCGGNMHGDGHNIPFETFLGFSGDKVPDFALNFDKTGQTAALSFLKNRFLPENWLVCGSTERILFDERSQRLVDGYEKKKGTVFPEAERNRIIEKLEGVICGGEIHPYRVFISPAPINDLMPVCGETNFGIPVTQFAFHDLYDAFFKCDMVQIASLNLLTELEKTTGVSLHDIPDGCGDLLQCLQREDTAGIPEFDNVFTANLSVVLKPADFSDLIKLLGFAHGTNLWKDNGETLFENYAFEIRSLPACRDDIYLDLLSHGVDSRKAFRFAEAVRRGLFAKDRVSEEERTDFAALIKNAGLPDWYFEYCAQIRYLFPKAHAVEYARLAALAAWYKLHFPDPFAAALSHVYGI